MSYDGLYASMASSARFDERSLGTWSTPQAGGKARDGALTPALLAVAAGAVPFKLTGETIDTIATRLASARGRVPSRHLRGPPPRVEARRAQLHRLLDPGLLRGPGLDHHR